MKKSKRKKLFEVRSNQNGSQAKTINIQILATSTRLSVYLTLVWLSWSGCQQKIRTHHFQRSCFNLWQTTEHKIPRFKIYLFIWIYLSIYSSRFWLQLFIVSDFNSRTFTASSTTKGLTKRDEVVVHSYPRSQDMRCTKWNINISW